MRATEHCGMVTMQRLFSEFAWAKQCLGRGWVTTLTPTKVVGQALVVMPRLLLLLLQAAPASRTCHS